MKQVQEGLFEMSEPMPCHPKAIRVWKYCLPSTLDHCEAEEAAARVLVFSQQLDWWVGVSWVTLTQTMQADYALDRSRSGINQARRDAARRYEWEMSHYRWLSIVTLGIYALLVARPTKLEEKSPEVHVPISGIFTFGPQHVVDGIHDLVARGFLRQETEGVGEEEQSVFFPTPALVERIMRVQGIAVS